MVSDAQSAATNSAIISLSVSEKNLPPVVKVKDLTSGEQLALAPEAAAAHISAGIAARSEGKPIREKA